MGLADGEAWERENAHWLENRKHGSYQSVIIRPTEADLAPIPRTPLPAQPVGFQGFNVLGRFLELMLTERAASTDVSVWFNGSGRFYVSDGLVHDSLSRGLCARRLELAIATLHECTP